MPIFDPIRIGASGVAEDYEVERSLRFNSNDGAKLTRTFGTNTSNTTKTVSFWMKRGKSETFMSMFSTAASGFIEGRIQFTNADQLQYTDRDSGSGSTDIQKITNRRLRDHSAWYHIVVAIDTTDGTADDRIKIYINGVRETSFSSSTNPSQNYSVSFYRSSADNYVGVNNNSSDFFDGYLAEINFIDGQALTPASFGETNSETGQWIPKKYSGGYGNNGYYLNFSDNSGTSATTLGKDNSGNSNNFTPSNFNVTANDVDNDSVLDTPTNNWCTLNPLTGYWAEGGSIPLSDGLLHADNPNSGDRAVFATFRLKAGKKYYFEGKYFEQGSGSQCKWAITSLGRQDGKAVKPFGDGAFGIDWRGGAGTTTAIDPAGANNIGSRPSNGQVIGVAIDLVNGKFYAHKGNSYYNSGDPANGTGAIVTNIPTGVDYNFIGSVDSGGPVFAEFKINFGQQGFAHQPTGFTDLLNSQELAEPTIPLPGDHFGTLLYVGNNGSQNITGLDFDPDWVWAKNRQDNGYHHDLYDTVRGDNLRIFASQSQAEATGYLQFGVTGGFSLTAGGGINTNNKNHVAWCWNAGSSTVTNSNGSITSQVRANTTAGFSIISYTGNGSGGSTVGHGLGVKPQAIFYKNRNDNGVNVEAQWNVSLNVSTAFRGSLNLTETNQGNSLTTFDSTTFSLASGSASRNQNNKNYIGYCFTSVEGYSSIGTFKGNGSNNGRFIWTGFAPAWIMIKKSNGSGNWGINDIERDFNTEFGNDLSLYANSANAETSSASLNVDFLSNGFKLRSDNGSYNGNGDTYLYMCFAQAPFKYARAR